MGVCYTKLSGKIWSPSKTTFFFIFFVTFQETCFSTKWERKWLFSALLWTQQPPNFRLQRLQFYNDTVKVYCGSLFRRVATFACQKIAQIRRWRRVVFFCEMLIVVAVSSLENLPQDVEKLTRGFKNRPEIVKITPGSQKPKSCILLHCFFENKQCFLAD